jgi:hypothetical protein
MGGKQISAHRAAWALVHGSIPDGAHVLHHCDVRNCVNPNHLYLGTPSDNMRDRADRGRMWNQQAKNKEAARAIAFRNLEKRRKLNENDVRVIRELRALGVSGQALAEQFGVVREHIYKVAKGEKWRSVK